MKDTQWYLEQAKKLDKVTRELNQGNPVKLKQKLARIDKAQSICEVTFAFCNSFGHTKEVTEAQNASRSILELARTALIKNFNRFHSPQKN